MKRGFTLLELIVVIIIIGVLATLGLTQYGSTVEKSRGAEAKAILGSIRTLAAAYRMQYGATTGFTDLGGAPSAAATSHYFSYAITSVVDPTVVLTATRPAAGSKTNPPATQGGQTMTLTSNFSTGADTWGGTGPW